MKKIITRMVFVLATLLALTAFPISALAAGQPFTGACSGAGSGSDVCKSGSADPLTGSNGALTKVASILLLVAGIIAVIFIILGGIKYILSGGDASSIASAKKTIIYATIGLAVAVLVRSIINFVINKV